MFERALPECQWKGALEYYIFPSRRSSWGGPFNGQEGRRRLIDRIFGLARPSLIIETGTFRGTTTTYFGKTGISTLSIEARARNLGFAKQQLASFSNVELRLGDSRKELRRALAERVRDVATTATLFAYLDAHWYEELPLADELEIIFEYAPTAIVMVDDFQIPGDQGYGYDDYGPGRALIASYVAPAMERFGLAAFYPTLPSSEESGARRGCVVLASREHLAGALEATSLLRQA